MLDPMNRSSAVVTVAAISIVVPIYLLPVGFMLAEYTQERLKQGLHWIAHSEEG